MDIRYLKYILVLAETGNMTRAASKLYISQPTLSQFLTKQEQELGSPLFQRLRGIYTLTPVGRLYADYARKVISLTDSLEKDIKRISTVSQIRIGTSASRCLQMLTSILGCFHEHYPKAELTLSDDNLKAMKNAISREEIDMAFVTANSLDQPKGQSLELKREEVVFAVPSTHSYCHGAKSSTKHSLTRKELQDNFGNTPFILQLKGSCIRYLIDDFWGNDFNPIIACNTSHAQSICEMVSSNIGVGFIPTGYAVVSPRITYFSLEPKMYRIHAILFRKGLIMESPHKYLVELSLKYVEENWKNL